MTAKTRHKIYVIVFLAGLSISGLVFQNAIETYCSTVSWVSVVSMMIFLGGFFYAVLERNITAGLVSAAAALALPWIKMWISTYWPWVQQCFISHP